MMRRFGVLCWLAKVGGGILAGGVSITVASTTGCAHQQPPSREPSEPSQAHALKTSGQRGTQASSQEVWLEEPVFEMQRAWRVPGTERRFGALSHDRSDLCPPWQGLGPRRPIYGSTAKKNILAEQKLLYTLRLPANWRLAAGTYNEAGERRCRLDPDQCDVSLGNLLGGSKEVELCWDKKTRVVAVDSLEVHRRNIWVRAPEHLAYELNDRMDICGVVHGLSYPALSKNQVVAYALSYETATRGSCVVEFKQVVARGEDKEPEHLIAMTRFEQISALNVTLVTLRISAKEQHIEALRGLMTEVASSLEVNWENVRRFERESPSDQPVADRPSFPFDEIR